MASFSKAFAFAMQSEDPKMECKTVSDAPPAGWTGGPVYAISGINSAVFPKDFAELNAMPPTERATTVTAFYKSHFWNQWYDALANDDLACRVFDMAVNGGPVPAARLLQQAVNASGHSLHVDGVLGVYIVIEANKCDGDYSLVNTFKSLRVQHYKDIVAAHPEKGKYLASWIARAER
jgi:lysozyme family protein